MKARGTCMVGDRCVVGDMCSRPDRRPNITASVLNGIRHLGRWGGTPPSKVASMAVMLGVWNDGQPYRLWPAPTKSRTHLGCED